jgi:hypothetical protein
MSCARPAFPSLQRAKSRWPILTESANRSRAFDHKIVMGQAYWVEAGVAFRNADGTRAPRPVLSATAK